MIIYSSVRNAGVAQLVEQLICNQQVGGSSPSTSSIEAYCLGSRLRFLKTKYGRIPEWPKGADFSGSNPLSPTKIGEYLLILADFYFPMGFINVINAVSPTVANRKE